MAIHIRAVARRSWLMALRVSLMLLLLFAAACFTILATEGGRISLTRQAVSFVSLWSGQNIQMTGIRSPGLGHWRIEQVSWRDTASGTAVTVDDLDVRWEWLYALRNRWWLSVVEADAVTVQLGRSGTQQAKSVADLYRLWSRIPAIRLEQLSLNRLTVTRALYPDLTARLDAQVDLNWGAIPLRFLLGASDENAGNQYALQLTADAIDRVRLQGALTANAGTDWAQWIGWSLQEPAKAEWDLRIDYSQPGHLLAYIDQWRMPWQEEVLQAEGLIDYVVDRRELQFKPVKLSLSGQPASISGSLNSDRSELMVSVDQWNVAALTPLLGIEELAADVSTEFIWRGGWRQPQISGAMSLQGSWYGQPLAVLMDSQARNGQLTVEQGQLTLGASQVEVSGSIDWIADELDFTVDGQWQTDPLMRRLVTALPPSLSGEGVLSLDVSGLVRAPSLSGRMAGSGLWHQDAFEFATNLNWRDDELQLERLTLLTSLGQVQGSVRASKDQPWQADLQLQEISSDILAQLGVKFPVEFNGKANGPLTVTSKGADFSAHGELNVLGWWQQWPLTAQLTIADLTATELSLGRSFLSLQDANLYLNGDINWQNGQLDLDIQHQELPLAVLPPWLPWPALLDSLEGRWSGQTALSGYWRRPAIRSDSQLVGSWLDEPISLSVITDPQTATDWQVQKFEAEWLGGFWQYRGGFKPYELALDGQVQVNDVHGRHVPLLSGSVLGNERSLPETLDVVFGADMAFQGQLTAPVLKGTAVARGQFDQRPVVVEADIRLLDKEHIELASASSVWADGHWDFSGVYSWADDAFDLKVHTDMPDAAPLLPWLQLGAEEPVATWLSHWQGSLNGLLDITGQDGRLTLSGQLDSLGQFYQQPYEVQWQGSGAIAEMLKHELSGHWGKGLFALSLQSQSGEYSGEIAIEQAQFDLLQRLFPDIPVWLSGTANADLAISGRVEELVLEGNINADGYLAGRFNQPFFAQLELATLGNQWRVQRSVLNVPDIITVAVDGQGKGLFGQVTVGGVIDDTQYWLTNEQLGPGTATFKVEGEGDLLQPQLTGELQWQSELWPLALALNLQTDSAQHRIDASLLHEQQQQVALQAWLPQLPLAAWPEQWQEADLKVAIDFDSDFVILEPLFEDRPDQDLTGKFNGDLVMTGSLQSPSWQGNVNWQQGSYEHAGYGARVNNINLSIEGREYNWTVTGAGSDGAKGRVAVTGGVRFAALPDRILSHQMNINIDFFQAQLLNRAEMDAAANGRLKATGSYHDLLLSGNLRVTPLNLQSDTFLADGAPQLNIVATETVVTTSANDAWYWPQGQWDATFTATNRANLYGQGISAELAGNLVLTEDLYQPLLSGRFNIVRGTYVGFGKVFTLVDGSVQIQNNRLLVNILGQLQTENMLVSLNITGNQDALQLELSSDSNLDQDELLAILLFGKLTDELDVVQAYQLAVAVNRLRTGDSGLDIIGTTRDELTLDSLIVGTNTDEEGNLALNISAGKYLNDYLYIEVEQGVGVEEEFRGSLQLQLTPKTYLEMYSQGKYGAFDNNGIELNWSMDY